MSPEDVLEGLSEIAKGIEGCRRCPLFRHRTRTVPGEGSGDSGIVVIGEAPGKEEDASGRPFVGRAGRILRSAMADAGLDPGRAFITNAVKCRPPGNRRPTRQELEACRPWLEAQLRILRPRIVVVLGNTALDSVSSILGLETTIRDLMDTPTRASCPWGECWVLGAYHPAYTRFNRKVPEILRRTFEKALEIVEGG